MLFFAAFGQSPNDLSNINLGWTASLEEELEHFLPDIDNQDIVSELQLQVNDEASGTLWTYQKWTEKANSYQTSLIILLLKTIPQKHQNRKSLSQASPNILYWKYNKLAK